MNIYLIRHGESLTNITNSFAGQLDVPLTDVGKNQAKLILEFFKDKKIDKIYSSTLSRAINTIKPTADYFNLEIIKDERLQEINCGKWAGKKCSDIERDYYQFRTVWKYDLPNCVCDGGESVRDCAKRGFSALKDIVNTCKAENIIITSHALILRTILSNVIYGNIEDIDKLCFLVNAGITLLNYENGVFTVKEQIITKHLDGIYIENPTNI